MWFLYDFQVFLLMKSWFPGRGVRLAEWKTGWEGLQTTLYYTPINLSQAMPRQGSSPQLCTPHCSSSLATSAGFANTHIHTSLHVHEKSHWNQRGQSGAWCEMFAALKFQELATGGLSSQPRARSIRVKENFKKDLLQHINTSGTKQQLTHPAWLEEYENSIKVLLKYIFLLYLHLTQSSPPDNQDKGSISPASLGAWRNISPCDAEQKGHLNQPNSASIRSHLHTLEEPSCWMWYTHYRQITICTNNNIRKCNMKQKVIRLSATYLFDLRPWLAPDFSKSAQINTAVYVQ